MTIESIAAGGDGVGRVDGMACFVPRTAPGDVVQVSMRRRARFATGRVLQLLTPSTTRVVPRCRHYDHDRCGGCQLQHIDEPAQREVRARIVQAALSRIAGRGVELPVVEQAPATWAYRRRLTLALQRRGSRWVGGLHPYDDPGRVFALDECPIAEPILVAAWHAVRRVDRHLPVASTLRLALRRLDDGAVAVVVIGARSWPARATFAAELLALATAVSEIWWEPERGVAECLVRERTVLDAPADAHATTADALAFVQVNAPVGDLLRAHVRGLVLARTPSHVIDAYAGSGLLTAQLVHDGIDVTAIELDAHATRRIASRLAERRSSHAVATVVTATVESALPTALSGGADILVLNPPRRGLDERIPAVLETGAAAALQAVVYVSCDPATLARDLARMPSWRIAGVRCFDMFPQTAHVETVCELVPERP